MNVEKPLPRRHTVRLPEYDYSQAGVYFITICTHDKRPIFGSVVGLTTELSGAGEIVDECWRAIPEHFPNVETPIHVVMPNHVHGIILIRQRMTKRLVSITSSDGTRRLGAHPPGSLPAIVRSFKSIAARRIREANADGGLEVWQRGYYEHIIRRQEEFGRIWEYIRLNPAMWGFDEENPEAAIDKPGSLVARDSKIG